MPELSLFNSLRRFLIHSTNTSELLRVIDEVQDYRNAADLNPSDADRLLEQGFRTLANLTEEEPQVAERIIIQKLLPLCTQSLKTNTSDAGYSASKLRSVLNGWISSYVLSGDSTTRDRVLDVLVDYLDSERSENACWSVASIGYRRDDVVEKLCFLVSQYRDSIGDAALSALCSLGVSDELRERLVAEAVARSVERINLPLITVMRQLAERRTMSILSDNWYAKPETPDAKILLSLALRIPIDVAEADYDNHRLQDEAWLQVEKLINTEPERLKNHVYLGSDMAPRCNSTHALSYLLEALAREEGDSESQRHRRFMIHSRILECNRPLHLTRWQDSLSAAVLTSLRSDACLNTGSTGQGPTLPTLLKDGAWDVILRSGHHDCLTWIDEALTMETNPVVQRRILDWMACLGLDSVPAIIWNWITEPNDFSADAPEGEWMPRLAAIDVARASASPEAFRALLDFGLTFDGQVLQQTVDALTDVALELINVGHTEIVDQLVNVALYGQEPRHRRAAMGTMPNIAEFLRNDEWTLLLAELNNETRNPFEKSLLLAALTSSEYDPDPPLKERIRSWASKDDDWLTWRSLEFLAIRGLLRNSSTILKEQLGLRCNGKQWYLDSDAHSVEWAGYIIGLLYIQDPSSFSPAVAAILREQDWPAAIQILSMLHDEAKESDQVVLPSDIRAAIIQRIESRQTHRSGETDIFRLVGSLIPDVLLEEQWEIKVLDWLPDSRQAFAAVLGELPVDSQELRSRVVILLSVLVEDAHYAVRRSAYRSMATHAPTVLEKMCLSWHSSPDLFSRLRAAEAYIWLYPCSKSPGVDAEGLRRSLSNDVEPYVRDAARRSWNQYRRQSWAAYYLETVEAAIQDPTLDGLDTWRYGEALSALADDQVIGKLKSLASSESLFHKRRWLKRIWANSEKQWRNTTRKWMDPWIGLEGAIDRGKGKIRTGQGEAIEVEYSLWRRPASRLTEKHDWGGVARCSSSSFTIAIAFESSNELVIETEDGKHGDIVMSSVFDNTMVFTGRGPYPE